MIEWILRLPRRLAMLIIRLYQKTLSFDHGLPRFLFPHGYCRFHPTCSQYGYECFRAHGLIKGSLYAVWRILRCNPWSRGGHDPIPKNKSGF
ncbi:membrane protein insertion efficiency factor YidD [Patescibacteria group bacterium]|nr:membrane protein insertion efficiency factor YidD [Patescibacteria group bacterium]MBU1705488.1 membrane protein insertion efficiency factor YidD [Patescibacteria group bacterium]